MKQSNRLKKGKKKNKIIKRIIITILIIIILCITGFIINDFIIINDTKTTNLVINNKEVSRNLKNEIIIEDEIIYLSKEDIMNFFDKYIYVEPETNSIITTYNDKIATINFENNDIIINGSKKKAYAHAIERNDTKYLPISEMKDVYGIEIEYIGKTNVVVIQSIDREQKKAIITSDVAVKYSMDFFTITVDRVNKGDYVVVADKQNDYVKVCTENGRVGYIKSDKISNEVITRQSITEEKQIQGKINMIWDYYGKNAKTPNRQNTNLSGVNVVSPAFIYLDDDGKVKTNIGENGKNYVQWAHNKGYKVWAMVSNTEASAKNINITSNIMNSYKKRQELIEKLVNECINNNLDGLNIDFENMKEENKDMFSRFIIELMPRLKEMGKVLSVDVTAPDGGETWSMCFDRNTIGNVADYIVFMAYDEYGASSTKAGTTSGYDWIELSLDKFINREEIKPDKVILGIPFFARLWTTNSQGSVTQEAIYMKNIDKKLPNDVEKRWDDKLRQYYVEYTEKNNKKQIWIEDSKSIIEKMNLIKNNNLAGVASWAMGMESDDTLNIIKENLQ